MGLTILYIGGSYPQRHAISSLVKAGHRVVLTDAKSNPPCAQFASDVMQVDATNTRALINVAKSIYPECQQFLVYGIADYACSSIITINQELGLKQQNPDAMRSMIDKNRSKELLLKNKLPVPRTVWSGKPNKLSNDAIHTLIKTNINVDEVIVKPNNANASTGVRKCLLRDFLNLKDAIKYAEKFGDEIVIEEYLAGQIWNMDVLVTNGKPDIISFTQRVPHCSFDFLPSAQIQIPIKEMHEISCFEELADEIARAFEYEDGPMTIDYILTETGPVILEISPHFHMISMEILRENGNPILGWAEHLSGNINWREYIKHDREMAGLMMMIKGTEKGIIHGVSNERDLIGNKHLQDYVRLKQNGDQIDTIDARGALVSLAFLTAQTSKELREFMDNQGKTYVPIVQS